MHQPRHRVFRRCRIAAMSLSVAGGVFAAFGLAAREGAGERAGDVMRVAKLADHAAKH